MFNKPVIDEDLLLYYIHGKTEIDLDTIEQVLEAELEFLKRLGIAKEGSHE